MSSPSGRRRVGSCQSAGTSEPSFTQIFGRRMVPRTHRNQRECLHVSTVTVVGGGLERVVCEDCCDVTVRYESMISGDVDRSQFSRKTDRVNAASDRT